MNKLFLTLIISCVFSFSLFGQNQNNTQTKRIETYLKQLEEVGFSGSVLVEIDNRKVLSKGYGYRNILLKEKNTPTTIFDIGSLTKQFTSAAILKLEMQGKLSTNDAITKYFKNVPDDKKAITIHELLRHRSGLKSSIGGDYDKISEEDFLNAVLKSNLRSQPGTDYSYSNIGYSLLAMIIEKASGKTYEDYLYENLWKPSGMESTGYSRPNFNKDLIAVGYKRQGEWGKPSDKEWDKNAPYWHLKGNGGILSTVEDLYKWTIALRSNKVLSAEANKKYIFPKLQEEEDPNSYYAYGWDIHTTNRKTILARHNGTNGIFYSDFYRFIKEGTTIIMLTNKAHSNFDEVVFEISKIIYEPSYQPKIPIADNEANRSFTEQILSSVLKNGLEDAKKIYENRPKKTSLLEADVNNKGYELLSENKTESAINLFEMNVFAFPKSANAYDSLAEAYMKSGNKKEAIKYYKKSLELNPGNRNAEEMLIELEK